MGYSPAILVLEDGLVFTGAGIGALGARGGELCFNTGMTGYQEILTDPSYAGQIIAFTFPHIGNVGINGADNESAEATEGAVGLVLRTEITPPSNWRAEGGLGEWLAARGVIGITGVDVRALTHRIREGGMVRAMLAHKQEGAFSAAERAELLAQARDLPSMAGREMALAASCRQPYGWQQGDWQGQAYREDDENKSAPLVAVIDYGAKRMILRLLVEAGCRVQVFPAASSAETILAAKPDGVLLSNGPGDPQETARSCEAQLKGLLASGLPLFGICLGHQMLALALGGRCEKMRQGHHGINHPVKEMATGKVHIVSMNHGFTIKGGSLPETIRETHTSLFDGSNCGFACKTRPISGVQYHPESSPGPLDSHGLFAEFAAQCAGQAKQRG